MHKARGELLLPVNGSIQTQFQVKTIQGLQVTRLTGRPTFAFEFFIQFEMLPASPLTLHLVCHATGNTQLFLSSHHAQSLKRVLFVSKCYHSKLGRNSTSIARNSKRARSPRFFEFSIQFCHASSSFRFS